MFTLVQDIGSSLCTGADAAAAAAATVPMKTASRIPTVGVISSSFQ